jgi:hypothetical protein
MVMTLIPRVIAVIVSMLGVGVSLGILVGVLNRVSPDWSHHVFSLVASLL